jgi:hypothetical protein
MAAKKKLHKKFLIIFLCLPDYLEVHRLSVHDAGVYNCSALNAIGMAVCSSQVEVLQQEDDSEPAKADEDGSGQRKGSMQGHFLETTIFYN